jgi:DMSO/TMAO reductase YedYZ molybdopterin-dependent catalytic subunit
MSDETIGPSRDVVQPSPSLAADRSYTPLRTVLISLPLALLAGLIAGLCAVLVMVLLRLWAGIPTPMELFGDYYLQHINVNTFMSLLLTLKGGAKTEPLGLALLAMLAIGTALGMLYAVLVRIKLPTRGYRLRRREWLTVLAFAIVMTLLAIILFWDQIRQNNLGFPIDESRILTSLGLLVSFGVYGLVLGFIYRAWLPKYPRVVADVAVSRRRLLLARSGSVVLGIGAGLGSVAAINQFLKNYASYDGMKTSFQNHITHPITPNNEHYVVTQNVVDPSPDIDVWRLEVTGLVNKPGSYTYDEFQKLPSTSRAITLECIANGPADHLMGNAIWQGVPLSSLLALHGGAQSTAQYVAFYSVDGYTISQPLSVVLEADTLLAYRMNGAEIPRRHGYPVRVLIPGRFGEENPKWLTRVALTNDFVGGLYSNQGWYNGPLHTVCRIDQPYLGSSISVGETVPMGGVAFAGNRGIQKVEVSVDGGKSWRPATLEPAISKDSWVFWKATWQPTAPGTYTLIPRAVDGTGAPQISQVQSTVPNGATGYDKLIVTVK